MTLLVTVYIRDESGEMTILEPDDSSQELAGFESFRKTFYGGEAARSLGLSLLPTLAETDLYVEFAELAQLKDEASRISENIDLFVREANVDSSVLRFRIQNILNAIERARNAQGNEVIW